MIGVGGMGAWVEPAETPQNAPAGPNGYRRWPEAAEFVATTANTGACTSMIGILSGRGLSVATQVLQR